jgi:hypothetical protein
MRIPVLIRTKYFMANKRALVDSGATDNFMHPNFATKMGLGMKELPSPRKIFNIDNTTNKSGKIMHYLDLDVYTKGIHREMRFLVTDIGSEDILLGYPWLASFEPKFSWRHAVIDERVLPVCHKLDCAHVLLQLIIGTALVLISSYPSSLRMTTDII